MSERLYRSFGSYQPDAQVKNFYEMEIACASILRGYMSISCDMYFTIEARLARFLDCALKLMSVGEQERREII